MGFLKGGKGLISTYGTTHTRATTTSARSLYHFSCGDSICLVNMMAPMPLTHLSLSVPTSGRLICVLHSSDSNDDDWDCSDPLVTSIWSHNYPGI